MVEEKASSNQPADWGSRERIEAWLNLPEVRGAHKNRLSEGAIELAKNVPSSFTKGQVAFYAWHKKRIRNHDVDRILEGDEAARNEFLMLAKQPRGVGDAVFHMLFQAYQPPVSAHVPDIKSPYEVVGSRIDSAYTERVKQMTQESGLPQVTPEDRLRSRDTLQYAKLKKADRPLVGWEKKVIEWGDKQDEDDMKLEGGMWLKSRMVFTDFLRHTVIPLMAMGEVLKENGVDSPLTLTFPQVTFRAMKKYAPRLYERLQRDHESGAVDVGLTNSHHSIAALGDEHHAASFGEKYGDRHVRQVYTAADLERQYDNSLKHYLKEFPERDGETPRIVPLHIPEQAWTELLPPILEKLQERHKVRFVTCLDEHKHNAFVDMDVSCANHLTDKDLDYGVTLFYRGSFLADNLSDKWTNQGDPLTQQQRDTDSMASMTSEQEQEWVRAERHRVFNCVVTDLFGGSPEHTLWRDPLYQRKNSVLTVSMDAETFGIHNRAASIPFMDAVDALRELGVEPASTRRAYEVAEVRREGVRRPWNSSWSEGGFSTWVNPGTTKLRYHVGETLRMFGGELAFLRRKFEQGSPQEAGHGAEELFRHRSRRIPRPLDAASEHYDRALMSCPYWWSSFESDYPRNVPTIKQTYTNLSRAWRNTIKVLDDMIDHSSSYEVVKEGAGSALTSMHTAMLSNQRQRLASEYERFLADDEAWFGDMLHDTRKIETDWWGRYEGRRLMPAEKGRLYEIKKEKESQGD